MSLTPPCVLLYMYRAYGNPLRSTQLAIQPRNDVGGRSMVGVYLCQVQSTANSSVIVNRTLTIHIHGINIYIHILILEGKSAVVIEWNVITLIQT